MKTRLVLLLSIIALFLGSCSTVQVSQDFDDSYNFQKAKTYNWNTKLQEATTGILQKDELMANRFFTAIDTSLTGQGFTRSENPDFLVSCTYVISTRIQSESTGGPTFGFGVGSYGRHGRYGGVGIQSGTSVRQYDRGLLTIAIHDSINNKLIWKGSATKEVFTHSSPEQRTSEVSEMVQSTLEQFPPVQ